MYRTRIEELEAKIVKLKAKNLDIEMTYGYNKSFKKNEMLIKEYEVVIDHYNNLMKKQEEMKVNE